MIYLDNAATTKPYKESAKLLNQFNDEYFYNPSSVYKEGVEVKKALKNAKENLGRILNCDPKELIFTSGATESINLAVLGLMSGKKDQELVFTKAEHSANYYLAKHLKNLGFTVRFADLSPNGRVDLNHLKTLINENTSIVSLIHVSNETGAINQLSEVVKEVKSINPKTLVISDGVQAFTKIEVDLKRSNVDAYIVSSHKIHGPKGVGLLYVKKGLNLKPQIFGGGQELGFRSGTENVAGIMAFEVSASLMHASQEDNFKKVTEFNKYVLSQFKENLTNYKVNGETTSPYIISLSIKGIRGEILVHMLQQKGVLISTGSSCSSNTKRAGNRVLEALNRTKEEVEGSIRISFGSTNTMEEIKEATKTIIETIKELREKMR